MRIVVFKITGLSPLLIHNPAAMQSTNGKGLSTKKIPSPQEEAAAAAYRTSDGTLYLPSIAFRGAIIGKGGGASGRKIGKYTANQRVSAGVFNADEHCELIDPKTGEPITDYEIHTARAVVQNNGVLRSRPIIRNWACRLPFEIDEDFVTVKQVLELLNISGRVAGVGDWRPQKKGPFGRFQAELEVA